MLLRAATPDDAEGIAAAHVRAWNETYRGIMPDSYLDSVSVDERAAAWRRRLAAPQDRSTARVAVDDHGTIAGFAVAGPARGTALTADGEVCAVNLVMQATRKGVGTRLMLAMAEGLAGHGFRSAGLWVIKKNFGARWFYERLGGVAAAQHERNFGGKVLVEIGYVWPDIRTLATQARALAG